MDPDLRNIDNPDLIKLPLPRLLTAVEKYVSLGERALREEAARQADAERRKAEADDSRQRALREMMHGTLEIKKELTPLENMVSHMHACSG